MELSEQTIDELTELLRYEPVFANMVKVGDTVITDEGTFAVSEVEHCSAWVELGYETEFVDQYGVPCDGEVFRGQQILLRKSQK